MSRDRQASGALVDKPRGLSPAVFPTNTSKSLADDPHWMKERHQKGYPNSPETIARRKQRNAAIRASNWKPLALAVKYNLNITTIRRILKGEE